METFPRYWPFVWGIHRWPVNSSHKGQWRGALMFLLICAWINGWNEAGDWRRHRADYDVIVMAIGCLTAVRRYHDAWYDIMGICHGRVAWHRFGAYQVFNHLQVWYWSALNGISYDFVVFCFIFVYITILNAFTWLSDCLTPTIQGHFNVTVRISWLPPQRLWNNPEGYG